MAQAPARLRVIYLCCIIASVVEWIAASTIGWVNSVAYVSHLSQLAITLSLLGPYSAAGVGKRQEEIREELDDDGTPPKE
jgi:hypothetical protein